MDDDKRKAEKRVLLLFFRNRREPAALFPVTARMIRGRISCIPRLEAFQKDIEPVEVDGLHDPPVEACIDI